MIDIDVRKALNRLDNASVSMGTATPGEYEIARSLLILAAQVSRVADAVEAVTHNQTLRTKDVGR